MVATEQKIIKDCLRGNKDAQYLLYKQYAATMLGVCYMYTKSIDDAEDVLQEGFIKVFTKLHLFKHEGNFGGWVRKIMVNTAINYLHKHQRYKKELEQEDLALHVVGNENPEINLNAKELVEMIRQLPGKYKVVFNLIAVEGFDYNEVCEMLNLNINTARSIYSRARGMMVEMIKKNNPEYLVQYATTFGR